MAVEIKYVVVRKGEEKMTFASKKEADAYDKMLDMAEVFTDWLEGSSLDMEEQQREALGMFLAGNKDALQHILRTSKMPEASDPAAVGEESAADVENSGAELNADDAAPEVEDEVTEASSAQTVKATKTKPAARANKAA